MKISTLLAGCCGLAIVALGAGSWAVDHDVGPASCASCTGAPCREPRCRATWDESKARTPAYAMTCEYACARGRDAWHAPDPECRCRPPGGQLYVKKRLYKSDGEEKVERVPKYDVEFTETGSCDGGRCCGTTGWWWSPPNLPWLYHSR